MCSTAAAAVRSTTPRKLRALGNVDEVYEPAYVEDLDLGYRAWQRGWPSVYVAGARGGTSASRHHIALLYRSGARSHSGNQLPALRRPRRQRSPSVFRRLWTQAIRRLFLLQGPAGTGAAGIALQRRPASRRPSIPRSSSWRSPMAASACSPAAPPSGQTARAGRQPLRAVPALARRRGAHV